MLKIFSVLSFFMIFQNTVLAQEFNVKNQYIQLKCKGDIEKFTVYLTTDIDTTNKKPAHSVIELGYKVKVYDSGKQPDYVEFKAAEGTYTSIEGSIEQGNSNTKYEISFPDYGYSFEEKTTERNFTTSLKLKAGLVQGNLQVECTAMLREVQSNVEIKY